jgi:hypothetical protein
MECQYCNKPVDVLPNKTYKTDESNDRFFDCPHCKGIHIVTYPSEGDTPSIKIRKKS